MNREGLRDLLDRFLTPYRIQGYFGLELFVVVLAHG